MKQKDLLAEHKQYLGNRLKLKREDVIENFVVAFDYPRDKEKRKPRYVFVLNSDYDDKLHGLTLSHLPRQELIVLFPRLFTIDQPKAVYDDFIKKLKGSYDSYRTYLWDDISNLEWVNYRFPEEVLEGVIKQLKRFYPPQIINEIEKTL